MRIRKGEYGYLRSARTRMIIVTVLMLAVALAIYFGAIAYFGTNQNLFTILSVLILLPSSKMAVNMIMLINACRTPCSEEAHRVIASCIGDEVNGYELYMTSEKENYAISHVTVTTGSVIALTEDSKCNVNHAQQHIRQMMQGNGYHGYTVKVFDTLKAYHHRLEVMQENPTAPTEQDGEVLQLLKQISL